ncbi:MAG: class I SAM-dependent methyltransferase [Thermoleophilia bacterium]
MDDGDWTRTPRRGGPLSPLRTYVEIADRERAFGRGERRKAFEAVRLGGGRAGARVLDLGAGQAWQLRWLAADYRPVGVEPSSGLVAVGRARLAADGLAGRVPLLVGGPGGVPVPEGLADAAIGLNAPLGYGDPADDARSLEAVAASLAPGARLVLELASRPLAERRGASRRTRRFPDGALVDARVRYDPARGAVAERQELRLDGELLGAFAYELRTFDPDGLEELLAAAGLVLDGVHGGTDGCAWRGDRPLVVVARRPQRVAIVALGGSAHEPAA